MSILLSPITLIVSVMGGLYDIIEEYFPILISVCLIVLCSTLAIRYFALPLVAQTIKIDDIKPIKKGNNNKKGK